MCFHVESLANEGYKVAIVGYPGSALPPALLRSSIKQHHLLSPPSWISRLPRSAFIAIAPFKLLLQAVSLFAELTTQVHPPPEVILVQTPPALPTLLIVKAAAALIKSRVIIDWHNLAFTILALRLGGKSRLVKVAEWLERWSGKKAYAHLFVTEAMKNRLSLEWKLEGEKAVLHDRPPGHFRRANVGETHRLMTKLLEEIRPRIGDDWLPEYDLVETTPFTKVGDGGEVQWREDRPALVVSSTSWTADEDFGMLLRSARLYEYRARVLEKPEELVHSRSSTGENLSATLSPVSPSSSASASSHFSYADVEPIRTSKERRRPSIGALRTATLPNEPATSLPKLLIIVTGKGELKTRYLAEIAHLESTEAWRFVRIRTAWLETQDYPLLLGSADIGVSLHTSSSGLDLPMKVVDMLGCGLPVCALDFACLDELVVERWNGVVFRDAEGLARQWESLLANHPEKNWLATGAGMQEPFDPPTPRTHTPTMLLSEPGRFSAPPMSPNPSLTLVHSPGYAPWSNGDAVKAARSRRSTWAGNWKHVMRPLLDPRTAMDEEEESSIDRDLVRTSAIKLNSMGAGILKRRARDRDGYTMAASSDSPISGGDGGSPSKNKHAVDVHSQREEHAEEDNTLQKSSAKAGFEFVSQAALASEGESQKGLRQRKSVSKGGTAAAAHQQHPFSITGLDDMEDDRARRREGDSIPAIQVSRPPGPS
ncbi:beta-1,4-mannosyltransferase [Pseudozyma hubeiensis SY62]|uniref:Chitobiosyldiphosphodolichol beta-mannosyltransferase n=1 Tax=Pseudozyma hubeiensis (strain SY62) TaxID=1305764 RepID=R9NX50_PSEHS|nr:beta-1,4-mannosyltransferase [Pseudozyma hubeiensis SY62]GAC93223.1 beta-1,4-mannosyltransferase [Pseudozyma hubeiensis SY62]